MGLAIPGSAVQFDREPVITGDVEAEVTQAQAPCKGQPVGE